ncbi:hypothetical protein JAO73_05430 [Hymenobacter sp. BT523]|uniref:hypothetical protein n=1 Tax=Hymenobacter sp. BT523 TaxID=2795725 RepID=UPI0018EC02CA|nr:hypothetical protein [Hymenobacter sp. BT523]MBJ6108440.1 hypothetical protein [Hymenobacter sp. BT523]
MLHSVSMRCFLFVALFLAGSCAAQAQTAPDTARLAVAPGPLALQAHADTAQAVHRLFKKQRATGGYFVLGGALLVPVSFIFWLVSNGVVPSGTHAPNDTPFIVGASTAAVAVTVGTVKFASFGRGREKAILAAYEQGKPLPPEIRQKVVKKGD